MKILFNEIPEAGLELDVHDSSWFPEDDCICKGQPTVKIFLAKKNNRVLLQGFLDAKCQVDCDRCLEPFELPLKIDFNVYLECLKDDDPYWQQDDHVCAESEMDVIYLREPVIDLFSILRQQVILTIPAKKLCKTQCLGLCPECGNDLNKGPCPCSGHDKSSPFQVLGKLKNS